MLKMKTSEQRKKILKNTLQESLPCRYIHIPIHNFNHWTLLVIDKHLGTWKHFNSLRPRKGKDKHYNVANQLQKIIHQHMKDTPCQAEKAWNPDVKIESVKDSPQQEAMKNDCRIIVCYIIRQYMRHQPIPNTLPPGTSTRLRADMVHEFLSDPQRSIKVK
ncbi:hypothetical protein ACSBR2_015128 [Camellia fascicularis]